MNVIRYARMSLEVITVPVTLVMFCKTAHIVLILMSALQIKRIIVIHWQLVRTLQVFSTVLVTVVLLGMEHFAKVPFNYSLLLSHFFFELALHYRYNIHVMFRYHTNIYDNKI